MYFGVMFTPYCSSIGDVHSITKKKSEVHSFSFHPMCDAYPLYSIYNNLQLIMMHVNYNFFKININFKLKHDYIIS